MKILNEFQMLVQQLVMLEYQYLKNYDEIEKYLNVNEYFFEFSKMKLLLVTLALCVALAVAVDIEHEALRSNAVLQAGAEDMEAAQLEAPIVHFSDSEIDALAHGELLSDPDVTLEDAQEIKHEQMEELENAEVKNLVVHHEFDTHAMMKELDSQLAKMNARASLNYDY